MVLRRVGVAVAAVTLTACGTSGETPSAAEESAYAESPPPVGKPVEFFLYTHCGVDSLRLGGRWWRAAEPVYGEHGPGGPPEGWGDPYQAGELTLDSERSVTFEANGTEVRFVPADDDRPTRMCK